MRHLHEKVKVLSERTAPEKEKNPDSAAAASMMMGNMMMMNETLMIGYGGPQAGAGYGAPGDIPDPYQQQAYGYGGGYGGGMQGGMGGGYY